MSFVFRFIVGEFMVLPVLSPLRTVAEIQGEEFDIF